MTQLATMPGDHGLIAESALLDGKFRVPVTGADVVHRERLTALLERATERPVTLVTAPPGAGKTVACAGWAAARASRRIAWLTLDEADREPARFWAGVGAALAAGGTGLGLPLVPRARETADDPTADLVNTVRKLSTPVVLVLDDVHVLAGGEVLPGLALLIHQAPASLRLILSGRADPGLHLAKMRLSGHLSEVHAADLACTGQEAAAYLDVLGLAAGQVGRDSLMRATEGWMAGARLAALIAARDGRLNVDAVATDPIVADYMRDEVLDRQPPAVRQFLWRTSIAGRLTPDFADLLSGQSGGARVLDTLHRDNSFVLRDEGGGYRYHPFLRQVLLGELRRELPAEVPVLFARASRWAAAQGDVIEAVRCAAQAAEWDALPHVLTEAGLAGALPDRAEELEEALGELPARQRGDPAVAAALAMARLCRGDAGSAGAYLGLAAGALADGREDAALGDGPLVVRLWLATLRLLGTPDADAMAAGRRLAGAAGAVAGRKAEHQALGLLWLALGTAHLSRWEIADSVGALTLAEHQLTAAGTGGMAARARGWLAVAAALGGDLATAAALSAVTAADPPDVTAACLAAVAAAQVAIDRDELLVALRLLDGVDPAAARPLPGEPDLTLLLALARARTALAEGESERADDLVRPWRERCQPPGPALALLDAEIALRSGDTARAAAALGAPRAGRAPSSGAGAAEGTEQAVTRARLLLAEGDPSGALALALTVADAGLEGGAAPALTPRSRLTALLTAAVAARRTGSDATAAELLEQALACAEPHELYRPFLDGGGTVHSAIALLVGPSSPAAGFAARVHEHFVCQPSSRAAGGAQAGREAPALTASELAVLRLLRSYMSNQDIADTLFLSVNTVKTHLRSVYYKLGVSSRREAVERGVRLRLL